MCCVFVCVCVGACVCERVHACVHVCFRLCMRACVRVSCVYSLHKSSLMEMASNQIISPEITYYIYIIITVIEDRRDKQPVFYRWYWELPSTATVFYWCQLEAAQYSHSLRLVDTGSCPVQQQYSTGRHWELPSTMHSTGAHWEPPSTHCSFLLLPFPHSFHPSCDQSLLSREGSWPLDQMSIEVTCEHNKPRTTHATGL